MTKIGVAGLGFMGSTHLQAYKNVPNVEIAAVCSSDERKLAGDLSSISGNLDRPGEAMDFGSAARYRTLDELFADANVDAVDLCLPSHLHGPATAQALNAGKHVLVEKPMALSGGQCDEMVAAAKANGKVLMVAQVLRFWPDYLAAYNLIKSGELGPVKVAFFRRKCAAPGWSKWMHDREKGGGGVFDLLIHDFDFANYLFGKPRAIKARGVEEMEKGIDLVESLLDYGDGPEVHISGGWHHPKSYPFSMEFTISCEGGTLDFHSGLRRLTLYRANGESEEVKLTETDGFQAECTAFAEACEKGAAPANCQPEESAISTKMALAMRTSRYRNGEAVEIQ